jgi:DNA-binding response OmpR family regulator
VTTIGSETNAARPLRVLIVDDHVDTTEALRVLFSVLGEDVRTARTAAEAICVARDYEPDLALLDIGLPDSNGYELAQTLRLQHGSGPYIVAITGWCRDEDRARAFAAGCDLHIAKPLEVDGIVGAIHAARKRMARRAAARASVPQTLHRLG